MAVQQLQLEWLRAGQEQQSAVQRGAPNEAPAAAPVHPLLVLLPWVWAEDKHVTAYTRLAGENGWDVLVARWPMLAMWVPTWSAALARSLLQSLGSELLQRGERPVVIWCFSGAAKGVYSSLLSLLASAQALPPQQARYAAALLRCAVGQVFDSSPVSFDSNMGRKLLSPGYGAPAASCSSSSGGGSSASAAGAGAAAALRAAAVSAAAAGVNVTAGLMDFCLLEQWDRDGAAMWTALKHPPISGPVLLLYSRNDQLADAAQISQLAAALRGQGRRVLEQVWQDSPHVGHLRADAAAYSDALAYLLSQALVEWARRSSRRREGQAWAAGWQRQEQQQQQQAAGGAVVQRDAQRSSPVSSNLTAGSGAAQQQQQLVMQPTRGIFSVGRGGKSGNRSSSQPAPATLTRAGTSATSSSSGAATPMLLQGGHRRTSSSAAGRPVVRISSWPATATAVAAAMSADGGSEPVCADSTLLSHSLRCLASSFIATRLNNGAAAGGGGDAVAAAADASGVVGAASSSSGNSPGHVVDASQGGTGVGQQQQHQQQQPFMQRVVSRLRSRL